MPAVPLVLLAGMNCTADLWAGAAPAGAMMPTLDRASLPEQVRQLSDMLPERFVIGGLSLGAIVAMAFAVQEPDRVAGLILVSTNARAPTDAQRAGWRSWEARLDGGETPRDLQASILGALLSPDALAGRPDVVARTLRMGSETEERMLRAQLRLQATRTDLRPGLGRVEAPALIVSGESDTICPPSFHADIAAHLPSARLVTLDGGHLLPLEQPAAVGDLVAAWLARQS